MSVFDGSLELIGFILPSLVSILDENSSVPNSSNLQRMQTLIIGRLMVIFLLLGKLSEWLTDQTASNALEITVQNVDSEEIRDAIELIGGASISRNPGGATIAVVDEEDIEAVLKITRAHGGKLASIEPVRKSLEDLFV